MFYLFVCWNHLQNIIFLARTIVKHGQRAPGKGNRAELCHSAQSNWRHSLHARLREQRGAEKFQERQVPAGSQGVGDRTVVTAALMSKGTNMLKTKRGRRNLLTQWQERGFSWEEEGAWLHWRKVKTKFGRLKTMEGTCRSVQETSTAVEKKLFLFGYKFLPQNKQQGDWWTC